MDSTAASQDASNYRTTATQAYVSDVDRSPRSESAKRVLGTALELFSKHGYDGTSLQLIADTLGVTKAAVYYHFHTKDEILEALTTPAFDELEHMLANAEASPGLAARREQVLSQYIDYLLRHRKLTQFLSQDISALSRPGVWDRGQVLAGRVESLVTGTSDGERARLWGSAILRGLSGALLSVPNADEQWLRVELNDIGRRMVAGYRNAQRHGSTVPPGS